MSDVAEDRISNLPGSILHHILSFVDTRDAARTSVLSKRWKYIWRSIPILKFQNYISCKSDKFIDFIDKTLEFHDESNIKEFSLYSDAYSNEPRIEKWISTVISHNVEDLTLQLTMRHPVLMPSSLFTCESLIKLRLYSDPVICFPKYISLPRLERFLLFGVLFKDECWNDQLFSNCPVLQFLLLGCCTWSDAKNVCISNPSLRKLVISNTEHQDGFQNCALKIDAPSLESLTYKGCLAKDYDLSSFPLLVEAHIDFFFDVYNTTWEQVIDYGALVSKFLRSLARVVYLTITDRTLQVITIADDLRNHIPSYPNLKELCLTQKVIADKALYVLLEKAPNLKSLKFERFVPSIPGEIEDDNIDNAGDDGSEDIDYNDTAEGEDYSGNGDNSWGLDMASTRFSFPHLKFVSFNKFTGKAWEMRWLKLILKNAKALVTMTISCDPISHMKSENLMADISSLPRASASCVFKFSPKQG